MPAIPPARPHACRPARKPPPAALHSGGPARLPGQQVGRLSRGRLAHQARHHGEGGRVGQWRRDAVGDKVAGKHATGGMHRRDHDASVDEERGGLQRLRQHLPGHGMQAWGQRRTAGLSWVQPRSWLADANQLAEVQTAAAPEGRACVTLIASGPPAAAPAIISSHTCSHRVGKRDGQWADGLHPARGACLRSHCKAQDAAHRSEEVVGALCSVLIPPEARQLHRLRQRVGRGGGGTGRRRQRGQASGLRHTCNGIA